MLKNYFKIAWRNLIKNPSASIINFTGLSTGLTCCLLMVMYMQDELSYDRFHSKGDQIVRVIMSYSFNGSAVTSGNFTSTKVLPAFKKNFPEVIDGVRLNDLDRLVKYKDMTFNEQGFLYADSSFFQMFDFKLLRGKASDVLRAPNQIVLTESAAKKYFGQEDPIGKVLQVSTSLDNFTVTGISADCPSNSQIKYDMVASFISLGIPQEETYFEANFTTYLLLSNKAAISTLQQKVEPFMKNETKNETGVYINYQLEPFTKVHLYSPYDAMTANGSMKYIYSIGAIALLVLSIACFTYINLSTARSMERAKEIGIRKVSGAVKMQVFWQFISESVLLSFLACVISIGLMYLLLPAFNQLSNKSLFIAQLLNPYLLGVACLMVALIALMAGSYPALIVANYDPIKVLKGAFKNSASGSILRQSLIVFQFVISLFLIASTIVIGDQLHFIQNKKLGYDRDHVIVTRNDRLMRDKMESIKTGLKTDPTILSISNANFTPVNIPGGYTMNRGDQTENQAINTRGNCIDEDYIFTNGLKLIAGSDLSRQDMLDATKEDEGKKFFHFVINETAAKMLGWKSEDAIGKKLDLGWRKGEIKGVVKDFHFASMHNIIEPLVLYPGDGTMLMMIKISGNNIAKTIAFLRNQWRTLAPHRPFEYHFMDEDFNKLYDSEIRMAKVFNVFSGIAILLACLGLFGLSSYAAKQRLKEIGIRKILGASMGNIFLLMSNTFIRLILISYFLAVPISWYVMNLWLKDFAYRVNMNWWIFALTGGIAILMAIISVSFQSIKSAFANPVVSLRTE